MNTEQVYFGEIYRVDSIKRDYYYGTTVGLKYVKDALLLSKTNIFGKKYMKDLNTGQRYKIKLTSKLGSLYVSQSSLQSFNYTTKNECMNLPKEEIQKSGNKYLVRKVKEK